MIEIRLRAYQAYSLQDLMQRVNDDYYIILSTLSSQAGEYALVMESSALNGEERSYFKLTHAWASALSGYIRHRDELFLPYLRELAEKETTKHNCNQCSGKCDMQHTGRIIEFTHALEQVKGQYISYSDGLKELPQAMFGQEFKAMHTTMVFLNEHVHQLWRIESDCVLPRIKTAQQNINAHS